MLVNCVVHGSGWLFQIVSNAVLTQILFPANYYCRSQF